MGLVEVEIVVVTGTVLVCVVEVKVRLTCVDGTILVLVTVFPVVILSKTKVNVLPRVAFNIMVVLAKVTVA